MTIPADIRVGPFDIKIVHLDARTARQAYGLFSEERHEIGLRKTFKNKQQCAETLVHELLHAIWSVQTINHKDGEERIVSKLSMGLTQVIRDNPHLVDYLKRALK